jgi:NADPH-dependent 2,4-dienoyl-CoA reductase/sulfur reductase-like enzyme
MSRDRIVIIGRDAAGMSAASKIRRAQPGRNILVLERTAFTSYSACGMPYFLGGLFDDFEQLIARSPETFREEYAIDVRTGHEVIAVDPANQRVTIRDSHDREIREPYDQLLIATGARPSCPAVANADAAGIFGLSTLASGLRVHEFMSANQPKSAVVVGGGYIGLEMAEALIRQGLDVSLVQRSAEVMGTLDPDMGKLVSQALRDIGVTLYLEEQLESFEEKDGTVTAVVTSRRTLPADLVILGMGVRPNAELAANADIRLGAKGAIEVDSRMRTSTENIWAAGDCAATVHRLTGQPVYIALGTVANKQGVVAGTNLSGGVARFPGVVGTAVSKICAVEVARTGLQEKELKNHDINYATATIKAKTRAGYFPGAGPITVKMIAERISGRLLGAQIVGLEGAAKRIDIVATALTAGMTVMDLIDLDLSYAPPFSPVWDPVQTAARQLVKRI